MSGVWFVICIPTETYESLNAKSKPESPRDIHLSPKTLLTKETVLEELSEGSRASSTGTFSTAPSVVGGDDAIEEKEPIHHPEQFTNRENERWSSSQGEKDHKSESDYLIDFVEKGVPMERLLDDVLERLGIIDAVWVLSRDQRTYQVSFPCDSGTKCDTVLQYLTSRGIGLHRGSTIGVIPCGIFYQEDRPEDDEVGDPSLNNLDAQSEYTGSKGDTKKDVTGLKALQRDFLKSITSRLTVAQVVEGVRGNASLTFDFVTLLLFASIIAAIGLMENNSIILVASMLISPLMGPILAGTFGAVVQDRSLWVSGVRTELVGLLFCVILGFFIGLIYTNLSWNPSSWPTSEMSSRGQLNNLLVGAFIALPSGGGVALSVLGGNIGSLVGVAISASLLPPAVNAGLLWGMSVVLSSYTEPSGDLDLQQDGNTTLPVSETSTYHFVYSDGMPKECAVLGVVSLLLTIVNIICIFIAAVAVLKIKEVAPDTNVPKTRRFWKRDIKIARDYNKTLRRGEAQNMGKELLEEWAKANGLDPKEALTSHRKRLLQLHTLRSIVEVLLGGHICELNLKKNQYQEGSIQLILAHHLNAVLLDVETDNVYQNVLRNMHGGLAVEPLLQNLMTWPVPELVSPQSHPSVWDFPTEEPVQNHVSSPSASKKAKKFLRTKYLGLSVDSVSNYEPVDSISEVEYRGRSLMPSFLSSTVSSYNNFLHVNRMGFWPSQNRFRHPSRFVVTPVAEGDTPSSHLHNRNLPSNVLDTITTV